MENARYHYHVFHTHYTVGRQCYTIHCRNICQEIGNYATIAVDGSLAQTYLFQCVVVSR